MISIQFKLISNGVKGIQSFEKRLNIFEYLKNKSSPNSILFLQETHSTKEMKLDGMMILLFRYIIPTINLIHAVFLLLFLCSITYTVSGKASHKHEKTLIIEALIDDTEFFLINLCNANTENDQRTTFSELTNLLENFVLTKNIPIIFAGDFHLFFDRNLEIKVGNPCLKKQSFSKLLHKKEKLNLCDIWQIRNPKPK